MGLTYPQEKRPGRPPSEEAQDIARHLVTTVKNALADRSHLDLSIREIARNAHVHPNMVRYYFGSADNLFASVVDEVVEAADQELSAVERSLDGPENPTRAIVSALAKAFYPDMRISSIMLIESQRPQSKFMEKYQDRRRWRLFKRIQDIVTRLIDMGVYRKDLDSVYATFTIQSLIAGPLAIGRLERADGLAEDLNLAAWENHVAEVLHGNFRARKIQRRKSRRSGRRANAGTL